MAFDAHTHPEIIDPQLTEMIRLRCEGHSYAYIAAAQGINATVVKRRLADYALSQQKRREEMVQLCSDQLDYLWRRQIGPFTGADKINIALPDKTVATLLKIQEQKAKLLGLNAPTQTQNVHSFETSSDAELIEEAAKLGLPIPAAMLTNDTALEQ